MDPVELKEKIKELFTEKEGMVVIEVRSWTPLEEKLSQIKETLFLQWQDIAKIINISPRTLHRWRQGQTAPGKKQTEIEKLSKIASILKEAFPEEKARKNFLFKYDPRIRMSPYEVLLKGKTAKLLKLLGEFGGIYS